MITELFERIFCQRWSRGHRARGQGQGHKKNPKPRPRTALPRTKPLEAKNSNAQGQGQGPGTGASVLHNIFSDDLQKKKLGLQKNFASARVT